MNSLSADKSREQWKRRMIFSCLCICVYILIYIYTHTLHILPVTVDRNHQNFMHITRIHWPTKDARRLLVHYPVGWSSNSPSHPRLVAYQINMNFLWINQVHTSECKVCKNLPFATEPIYYQHHWWCPYPKESVLKTVLWSCQLAQTREHWIPIPLCCKNYTSWFLDIWLDFYIDYRNMFILTYYTQYSPICWFNRDQRFKGHLLDPPRSAARLFFRSAHGCSWDFPGRDPGWLRNPAPPKGWLKAYE